MTKKAKVASDYLANQAVELTQENIDNKESTEKSTHKRKRKQQKELNELNNRSKVKESKKHSGNFNIY